MHTPLRHFAVMRSGNSAGAALVCGFALFAVGCGDDVASDEVSSTAPDTVGDGSTNGDDGGGIDDSGADAGESPDSSTGDSTTADAGSDTLDTGGVDTADTATIECPGGPGCSCNANEDCDTNICINGAAGRVCATKCTDSCPAGFACLAVSVAGADNVTICSPIWDWICDPCSSSPACAKALGMAESKCVDHGNSGAFCGVYCSDDGGCPTGFACKPVKSIEGGATTQCVPTSTDAGAEFGTCTCSEPAKSGKLTTACRIEQKDDNGVIIGLCPGTRACGKDGLSTCIGPPPDVETCNGVDDDCDGKTDESTCDDGNPCTVDACDAQAKKCKITNLDDNTACDDGSSCTKSDTCKSGQCLGKGLVCDDGNPCTDDGCDAQTGCKSKPLIGAGCSDNNPCTVGDTCKEGACTSGKAKACPSDGPCTQAKCSLATGECVYQETTLLCDDGNACTSADTCAKGFCTGKPIACDDSNGCTADSCAAISGCTHKPTSAPCDDSDPCSDADTCAGGSCVGLAKDATVDCDDSNPCTADTCDIGTDGKPGKGCQNTNAPGPCSDGNPCTANDACGAGKCGAGTNICACTTDVDCAKNDDGNPCTGTLFCDKSGAKPACKVNPATVVACNSAGDTVCSKNTCDSKTGKCAPAAVVDNKPCDADGSVCTSGDRCKSGACAAGNAVACGDGNPCTNDGCDAKSGCVNLPNASTCNADNSVCTAGDRCALGTCGKGAALDCNDANSCTNDACDAIQGCVYTANSGPCDADGSVCTESDTCKAKVCASGQLKQCDDGVPCTVDACDAKLGCTQTADTKTEHDCYSGPANTQGVGTCKAGKRTCKADATFNTCVGEVVPTKLEACDGVDDTCDGVTDEACVPVGFDAQVGGLMFVGSDGKYSARAWVGEGAVGPLGANGAVHADVGFYRWLRRKLGN